MMGQKNAEEGNGAALYDALQQRPFHDGLEACDRDLQGEYRSSMTIAASMHLLCAK